MTTEETLPDTQSTTPLSVSGLCNNASLISGRNTRSVSYFMDPMGLDECDSPFIYSGWYQFAGGQTIPTYPVIPGQCGTNSPIYLQGTVVVTLRYIIYSL